jgi:amino acid permease
MPDIQERVKNVLDEARMLILGAQVLVGLQFRSFFEKGFDSLPLAAQALKLLGLGILLVAIGLLISPMAYHRIVERGEDTDEILRYTSRLMKFALLPFALGLGLDLYVATQKVVGWKTGVAAGLAGALAAIFFWYLLEIYRRRERAEEIAEVGREDEMARKEDEAGKDEKEKAKEEREKLNKKVQHALTECRVVLPGAQALMGFQFIAILTEAFDKMPPASKYIHLACVGMSALAIIFLMTPAAYHRIVERGEITEHFHRFASRMLIASLIPLALGLCGDVYVVVEKVTESQLISVVSAIVILAIFWELWFGLTLYRRTQREYAS